MPMSAKDHELLGNANTARRKLYKAILYDMALKLTLHYCYRCGKTIDRVEDLSIDHKISWRLSSDPAKSFFDLNNIAFSHLRCNVSAGDRTLAIRHKKSITHCPKGHEYTNHNTRMYGNRRNCRECGRVASKLWKSNNRG